MTISWVNVTAACEKQRLDALESWFWDVGAVSVTVEDAADAPIFEPPPGEQPLWDQMLVTGLFEDDVDSENLTLLLQSSGFQLVGVETLSDRPWERAWLDRFKPMSFGQRLWICPTGYDLDENDRTVIHLDPGLAFGTGTHETTRLCLNFLDGLDVRGLSVIDYGCGSGILGIAAALLGAESVTGIDNDPQALTSTQDNANRNRVEVATFLPGVSLEPADLILANILAQPLVELSAMLISLLKPGGNLVLSGIMSSQANWVIGAYEPSLRLVDHSEENGWVRLHWNRV